jgi:cytochrome c553
MIGARSNLRLILQAAMLAVMFPAAGHAQDVGMPARQGGLGAKLEYCKTCHGLQGQGYLGYFPMPRLAEGRQGDHWPREKESSMKGFPKPMFLHAPPVMARRARARMKFRDWRVNSMRTP